MAEDPAFVPMKDYVDALFTAAVKLVTIIDEKNTRYTDMVDQKNQAALQAALASEQLARTVALVEIKAGQSFHNDLIRKGERDRAETRGEMVTRTEFRPVADFVERSRQSAITTGKFVTILLAAIGMAMTFGFSLANYLKAARTNDIEASAAARGSSSGTPEVVIPLPPAEPR